MTLSNIFLFFVVFKQLSALVCNETRSVLRVVPETYQYTYYEAYEDDSCFIWCTKSRQAVGIRTRQVKKLEEESVSACCDGYIEDVDYKGNGLQSYCVNPNQCACEAGYAKDPNDMHTCIPLCLEGCETPDCLSTCSPYDDYHDESETDMCDGSCLNGTCVAPGVCHCGPGYRRKSGVCQPICSKCDHGTCVAPEVCKCKFGWHEECGSCKPACSGCEHGICKAPGQCECNPGYRAKDAQCEPYCLNCANGNCVAPGVCACEPGWYINEDSLECTPHCDVACGYGTCVAPNHCECYTGYRVREPKGIDDDRYNEEPQCVPICENCDGDCIAPDICTCGAQYDTIYTTADGNECDCFDCSDSSRKCERIACREKTNETSSKVYIEGLNKSEIFKVAQPYLEEEQSIGFINTTYIDDLKNYMADKTASCTNLKSAELTYHWIYIIIILIELLVIITMLVILKRKHLLDRLKIKKFVPQDKPNSEVAVHYTSSVVCSKLNEKDSGIP